MGYSDHSALLHPTLLLRRGLLLGLGHTLKNFIAILLGCFKSFGLPSVGLVGKILLMSLTSMGNTHIEPVVLLLWLVDSADAVTGSRLDHGFYSPF